MANGVINGDLHIGGVTLDTGTALKSQISAGNTALLQAYDVDGTAYVTFATLTSNNTPTFDLSTAVTIGGVAIGTVKTLTGDSGGALTPSSGNFTIAGAGGVTTSGSGSTITITGGGAGFTDVTVQTTDATPTAILTLATSSESVTTVEGIVAAASSTYADCCGGRTVGVFKNDGGVLTQVGSTGADVETTSTATFTYAVSGTNILLQVTGIVATTYNWKFSYRAITN